MKKVIKIHALTKIYFYFGLLVISVFWLDGCTTSGPKPTARLEEVIANGNGNQDEIKEFNDKLFAYAGSAPSPRDYVLREGDLIQVTVFESEDLNAEARLSAQGFTTLPLLGPVELKNLTAQEAEQKIRDLYAERYLYDPHVSVFVKEQNSSKVTIMGAVQKPGSYEYPARQRLWDVLALGGGLSEKAGQTVQIRRVNESGQSDSLVIDLEQFVKEGRVDLNVPIEGGDVVFVPEAGMVYVDGAVRNPGNYPIKNDMGVHEAIVAAGGFSTIADENKVKLIRFMGGGKREVVQLSLKDIKNSESEIVQLRDKDILFVEANTLEALLYGLRFNFGMGLFGFGYSPPPQ